MLRAAAFMVILLAGCAEVAVPEGINMAEEEMPLVWDTEASGCFTTAAFFLVEYHHAAQRLPLGFRPRDLSDFIYNTPVTSGQIPAYVALSTCEDFRFSGGNTTESRVLRLAYVGFFVHPPQFTDVYANEPADYDFYSIAYFAPTSAPEFVFPEEITSLFQWAQYDADVELGPLRTLASQSVPAVSPTPERIEVLESEGRIVQNGTALFEVTATGFFPQTFAEPPRLRFWQDGQEGIGFMEFELPMRTVAAGPLLDYAAEPGTVIHDTIGVEGGEPDHLLDSFALVFPEHELEGRMRYFPEVHAA